MRNEEIFFCGSKELSLLIAVGQAAAEEGDDAKGSVYSRSSSPEGLVREGR